ncbi:hypothetical protein PVAP13_5KG092087 [Panicum virgatum]|uniref:Uncharacterized protein n=1 Tax=Panicum virgatum TaxID=38727 RepID=A0A8T0SF54_PANVG|nr:hypothetical protein PVAP13_5KG092087 [Panicum virgatum]
MSPPPRALPKSPKVLRARPPRVCCFSPRSHPEPRVAARPVLLSQIHASNSQPPCRGAAPLPAHCSSPKSTPPCVQERETGQPRRPPRPGAAASTHGRAGDVTPTARAARNAGPAGGCGRRERVRDRGSRRMPCARIRAGDLPGGGCCTIWTMEHIHSCGRRAHRWRRLRSRMGRIDPLVFPTARAPRHAPSFNLHQDT